MTVRNDGTVPRPGWTTGFTFGVAGGHRHAWNATVSQSGAQVTATNESYNGVLAAGGSTTWGLVVTGATPRCPA